MMYIQKAVYGEILLICPKTPPEIGGILGGRTDVITHFVLDQGCKTNRTDFYIPNTTYLNETLAQWAAGGITFRGIFHTHPHGSKTLSYADSAYIEAVVRAYSTEETPLYFPIILPQKEIIAYSAILEDGAVLIQKEPIVFQSFATQKE